MTSEAREREAFVWVWLPGRTGPVVAGRLFESDGQHLFIYGRSYLGRPDAIALYDPELPLRPGVLAPPNGLPMPGCIRDAAPDAWGRRVIVNRHAGARGRDIDAVELDELDYLLASGSDRSGALDFQRSPTRYEPREVVPSPLETLLEAVDSVEKGIPLAPDLDAALFHGSSIGGARPKAMVVEGDRKFIAKFSSQSDVRSVVKAEYVAMRLAAEAGIRAAPVRLARAAGKDVLLVERFDRPKSPDGWLRRAMVSALTLLELDEMMARYASYGDLAAIIRRRFAAPRETLHELFARLVFNVLCGNTDDHARNHAAFWDGHRLELTPAYDICPQPRTGGEASQAMLIAGDDRRSRLDACLGAAATFQLHGDEALALAARQITVIRDRWAAVCAEAGLSEVDRIGLWRRQFLHPYAFEGAPPSLATLLPQ
ncbi:phosphatidylinositol kinase [Allostella vacuolata]|nr:phosphatidylinositol kinase [Stella vacuolata]